MNTQVMADDVDVQAFVTRVQAFLDSHASRRVPLTEQQWGVGPDRVGLFPELSEDEERQSLARAREWRRALAAAGLSWISGPVEYGGAGLPRGHERLLSTAVAGYDVPSEQMLGIGLHMVAPTIMAHGSETAKHDLVARIRSGEVVACQLFSEPDAGSDLAGVRTRAVRDGDGWRITGAKMWTSYARNADVGLALCRTDSDVPKHQGLTVFLVDMHATGVEVRPLRQMTGGATFTSVTLDDVAVADAARVGEPGDGWTVVRTTLANERASIGDGGGRNQLSTTRLVELLRANGRAEDPVALQLFADLYARTKAVTWTGQRARASARAGAPGPETSVLKIARAGNMQRLSELLGLVLGEKLVADTGEWGTFAWSELVLGVPGLRIGGGTDEVQKNIIAERVLGLPKEPPVLHSPSDRPTDPRGSGRP